jgi:hypothetical protein
MECLDVFVISAKAGSRVLSQPLGETHRVMRGCVMLSSPFAM